ncbi:MAG: PqqD family protein [Thermodesulfovibrionia bacterium]|nr:PqqD family protein [Thermodesulfovibrionia bacterium]MCK5505666.1 PqqD family protein [Thermodesulfovibrionia bacterium]
MELKDKYPDKSPLTASRLMDGEAVVIMPQDNEVKILNEAGSRIWELLDGRQDISQISRVISDEFEVSCDKALEDIIGFIDELYQKKMVVLLDRPKSNDQNENEDIK